MNYQIVDSFVRKIKAALKFFRSASVPDSAKFRWEQIINSWERTEQEWIQLREQKTPGEIVLYHLSEMQDLCGKLMADLDWVSVVKTGR